MYRSDSRGGRTATTKSASIGDRWRGESSVGLLNSECLIPDWQFGKFLAIFSLIRRRNLNKAERNPRMYESSANGCLRVNHGRIS